MLCFNVEKYIDSYYAIFKELDNKAYDTIPQTSTNSGLNACLDHRGEVYVPELSKTFTIGGTRMDAEIPE